MIISVAKLIMKPISDFTPKAAICLMEDPVICDIILLPSKDVNLLCILKENEDSFMS